MDTANGSDLKGYKKTFREYGESPQALQWSDYRSAASRYRELLSELDLNKRTILDVGCGMGDLLPYIYARTMDFKYLGVDIVEEFIDVAKKRYAGHSFRLINIFKEDLGQTFDVVILCGALNANRENWLEKRKAKIKHLYELANEVVVFNMAGGLNPNTSSGRVAQADARIILDFCATLTPKIILKTNYRSDDFTIVMFRK